MTHPPSGPSTPPPPSGPKESPLDPDSPRGREVAERLTRTLAQLRLEVAERKATEAAARAAA